jgi:hypothetical protein
MQDCCDKFLGKGDPAKSERLSSKVAESLRNSATFKVAEPSRFESLKSERHVDPTITARTSSG